MADSGRAPAGQALAVPVEPASGLAPSGFDPSREQDFEKLDAWAFNIMLECAGRDADIIDLAIGGAVLNLRDLQDILYWAQDTAIAMETRRAETTGSVAKP